MVCTLVTYSLQLLPKVDHIITVANGGIQAELITSGGLFSNFVTGFVTEPRTPPPPEEALTLDVASEKASKHKKSYVFCAEMENVRTQATAICPPTVMQGGERFRGFVSWSMPRSNLLISFAYTDIPWSTSRFSGIVQCENFLPHVHCGGCHLLRILVS